MQLVMQTVCEASATTGTMIVGSELFYTIEQPWRENAPGMSCVPAGQYALIPYSSPTHGPTWCLHNPALNIYATSAPEDGRSYCEIHAANWADQLQGCIALGLEGQPMVDPLTGQVAPAVEDSRDAVLTLIGILGVMSTGHILVIKPR